MHVGYWRVRLRRRAHQEPPGPLERQRHCCYRLLLLVDRCVHTYLERYPVGHQLREPALFKVIQNLSANENSLGILRPQLPFAGSSYHDGKQLVLQLPGVEIH